MVQGKDMLSTCYTMFEQLGKPLEHLNDPCRSAIIVDTALGIIGNGGFQYFFEANFSDNPDYGIFVDAFQRVGLNEIAQGLAALLAMFPFEAPHQSAERRQRFLEASSDEFEQAMQRLEDLIYARKDLDSVVEDFLKRSRAA
ncbi:DUF4375 domain-containing protein [Massilia sp. IC2-476]|uniref:DMP19 family protein n=1 Tax=Massilia sp. IC2-476 TaxID=2887199 RepID=UPI001D12E693|nr:DUF4375 domain-containing protein [Massilia sp. IC2-476]MCC2970723.1 DMP19 family protein [Massilia sp. IC2-476]